MKKQYIRPESEIIGFEAAGLMAESTIEVGQGGGSGSVGVNGQDIDEDADLLLFNFFE